MRKGKKGKKKKKKRKMCTKGINDEKNNLSLVWVGSNTSLMLNVLHGEVHCQPLKTEAIKNKVDKHSYSFCIVLLLSEKLSSLALSQLWILFLV